MISTPIELKSTLSEIVSSLLSSTIFSEGIMMVLSFNRCIRELALSYCSYGTNTPCNSNPWVLDNNCAKSKLLIKNMAQTNDILFGHGQQLSEVSSPSKLNIKVMTRKQIFAMCQLIQFMTLTSGKLPWVNIMTHFWVKGNNCVKFYQIPIHFLYSSKESEHGFGFVCTVTLNLEIQL